MVKIRFSQMGSKKRHIFRIVAIEEARKRQGKVLDVLGFWNPKKNEKQIDQKKLELWIKKGAVVSKSLLKLI